MDYFMLCLSFIGWFLLIIPTLGLIMIYVAPYLETTLIKFLSDIKDSYEGVTPTVTEAQVVETAQTETAKKKCANCGTEVDASSEFCTNCGQKME